MEGKNKFYRSPFLCFHRNSSHIGAQNMLGTFKSAVYIISFSPPNIIRPIVLRDYNIKCLERFCDLSKVTQIVSERTRPEFV